MIRKILYAGWLGCVTACAGGDHARDRRGAADARSASAAHVTRDTTPVVLFLGTSLTAGLGVDPVEAYPALIARRVDSLGLGFRVVNAGLSGETSAGGLRRIAWLLRQPVRVLVIELGANDALRGHDLAATRRNLQAIIDSAQRRDPRTVIVLAGMEAPPNLGASYTREFRALFPALARTNSAALIPFLLEGVGGNFDLNQPDAIHPTAEGHRVMAETVWRVLEPVLRAARQR